MEMKLSERVQDDGKGTKEPANYGDPMRRIDETERRRDMDQYRPCPASPVVRLGTRIFLLSVLALSQISRCKRHSEPRARTNFKLKRDPYNRLLLGHSRHFGSGLVNSGLNPTPDMSLRRKSPMSLLLNRSCSRARRPRLRHGARRDGSEGGRFLKLDRLGKFAGPPGGTFHEDKIWWGNF
jgi:hypothetical protein